ncbi:MAG: tRNA (adenosine(37)-N6)-threonylcarbamoyltransferase complex ATPase subunit type 1 TsaE [Marinilabiliales bacterium]|nr:MAG: tRNA (adenosine(37)-N6)-threonylcarbamoyltransferase complex ATPase subunit type 1 TsaE [Marinilabiliales bacterium]
MFQKRIERTITGIDDLPALAEEILKTFGVQNIFLFHAEMGAGKTTLIKYLCVELDVVDEVTSPTFAIVNEYSTKNAGSIYHMDMYRIKDVDEALQTGVFELLNGNEICFIEWPELIEDYIETEVVNIKITIENSGKRMITIW